MTEQATTGLWTTGSEKLGSNLQDFANRKEYSTFLRTAFAWRGSATPIVLSRLLWVFVYSAFSYWLVTLLPFLALPITPFEYSGAVLGLLLVLRVNSGLDRWWEARKIWGSIVNQTRNLATIATHYAPKSPILEELLDWVTLWPFAIKEKLNEERSLSIADHLVGRSQCVELRRSGHKPLFIGVKVANLLCELRRLGFDDFSFLRAEQERSLLMDNVGKCERIKGTPIPLVLAIKTRRFITLFLLLLPFALVSQTGILAPFIATLAAYPMLSLDEIGMQLQDPFVRKNLSHLPLEEICVNIGNNVRQIRGMDEDPLPTKNEPSPPI